MLQYIASAADVSKTIHKNLLTTCKIISASAKINSCYKLERHIIANATEDVHSILLPTDMTHSALYAKRAPLCPIATCVYW